MAAMASAEPATAAPVESAVVPVAADTINSEPWKQFTPSSINTSLCLARVWADGAGGQCRRAPQNESSFCAVHSKNESWRTHGRVDGDIPAKKLQEFMKASKFAKTPKLPAATPSPGVSVATPSPKKKDAAETPSAATPSPEKEATPETPAPKRIVGGAWGVFLAEKRSEFAQACEGQPVSAIVKKAGEAWKAVSEEEKALYTEKYNAASAKYTEDMAAWVAAGGKRPTLGRKRKMKEDKDESKQRKMEDHKDESNVVKKLREEIKRLKILKTSPGVVGMGRKKKAW